MIHAAGRLVEHGDKGLGEAAQSEPRAKEGGGDTIEYERLGSGGEGAPQDERRIERGQGKGTVGEGDKFDAGAVA